MILGAFLMWMGAFQLIGGMLPREFAMKMAEEHGKWTREHIFHLPPLIDEAKEPQQ